MQMLQVPAEGRRAGSTEEWFLQWGAGTEACAGVQLGALGAVPWQQLISHSLPRSLLPKVTRSSPWPRAGLFHLAECHRRGSCRTSVFCLGLLLAAQTGSWIQQGKGGDLVGGVCLFGFYLFREYF